MWLQLLMILSQVSALLRCDQTIINTTAGGRFNIICKYKINQFRFSKKYWCLGESRHTCEILMDTDGFTKAAFRTRAQIVDEGSRGLRVFMSSLDLGDTGVYWAGIEKIYSDIMVKIQVAVREEGVSIPEVWPRGSPLLTCQGQPITLHCKSAKGTNVQYSWYREAHPADDLLQRGPALLLLCASLSKDGRIVCAASNTVSGQRSRPVSLHVLQPGWDACVYMVASEGIESYDCWRTTQPPPTTSLMSVETSRPAHLALSRGQGHLVNQTLDNVFLRSWSGVPVWYDIIRWFLFTVMVATVGLVHVFTKLRLS